MNNILDILAVFFVAGSSFITGYYVNDFFRRPTASKIIPKNIPITPIQKCRDFTKKIIFDKILNLYITKIILICLLMIPLMIVGVITWNTIEENSVYSIKDLLVKYPLISDLKLAVDSGELNYDKLPSSAKEALERYESSKDNGFEIIEGINP